MSDITTYHRGQRNFGTGYDMIDQIEALEAKLAKAVEALQNVIGEYDLFRKDEYERGLAPLDDKIHKARAARASVKGVA